MARPLIFAIALALVALVLAPALHQPLLSFSVLAFFSRVCHQDPARSFWIAGVPMAVCARCFGIYLGGVAGALMPVQHRVALRMLAATVAMNFFDVVAESAGLHASWPFARLCLGAALGAAIVAAISSHVTNPSLSRLAVHSIRRTAP